ncbi:Uncharacterized protein BP5553_02519 [Venustampulla echinocandica]|uniref:Uncharacterized protein n=1 Tax=Venustampulla echinocandica TaxID=2656787 RepID=A0A370U439_9HELO|nr:Uncharacterized protein BP5553_02519 [Venustampulla echinocandica]RDL42540.1 Uncharacterized protein BP5553_02519 [Venustampulla echinocandica]
MDSRDKPSSPNIFTIRVEGPHEEEGHDHKQKLLGQLTNIPKNAQVLQIENDTPSDVEWSVIGSHFSSVKDLRMDTGFNEELNDERIPSHWPIERLLVSSACAEVFRSPFVLEGKVKHLILLLTSGLRFEGPTSEELYGANDEAITRGDVKEEYMTVREGTPEERKITLVYLPKLVGAWMEQKYAGQEVQDNESHLISTLPDQIPDQIHLEAIEILENDAIDTFTRMTLALPHLVTNLKTLNIRSSHGLDFHFTVEEMFREVLPQLAGLKTLILTAGDVFRDDQFLALLYTEFPPNLSTLRFRGPISLAKSEHWERWVESFGNPQFLPNLKKLSFVLDLAYEQENPGKKKEATAQEEQLREAKAACLQLYANAEKRGITIESFVDKWAEDSKIFKQVDDRWDQL